LLLSYYRGCWHEISRSFFCRYRQVRAILALIPSSLLKAVYNPRAFFPHAASLHQGFPHCAKFPTAASRRSLDRVSVPVWLIILSDQLPIIALVGLYPTNKLIGRGLIYQREARRSPAFLRTAYAVLAPVSRSCPPLIGRYPRVTHPCATRQRTEVPVTVRLACVRHAASVRPEPGSNSP
jgi:hypothetical protein